MTTTTAPPAARTPRIDDRDWSRLTLGERIRQIEVEGYLVLPNLLTPAQIARLKAETAKLTPKAVDYSPHQKGQPNSSSVGRSPSWSATRRRWRSCAS
jgi:hypothetical protein